MMVSWAECFKCKSSADKVRCFSQNAFPLCALLGLKSKQVESGLNFISDGVQVIHTVHSFCSSQTPFKKLQAVTRSCSPGDHQGAYPKFSNAPKHRLVN